MEAQWSKSGIKQTFQRLREPDGSRDGVGPPAPSRPAQVLVFLVFLVKNPRAVSEATTKVGRRARVRRCVQISEEFFSVKEFFQIFPPIKTFGELGIDP